MHAVYAIGSIVPWTATAVAAHEPTRDSRSVSLLSALPAGAVLARDAMAVYLREHPDGKLLHDPLAACAILDRDAFQWEEVEVIYERGQWGANPRAGTATSITVALDPRRAEAALFDHGVSSIESVS